MGRLEEEYNRWWKKQICAAGHIFIRTDGKTLPVPEPGSGGSYSGKFIQRMPKSLHARIAARAKQEGVSMNSLVNTFLAESLGRKETAQ
ncbi:MAG: toxin-antitoxin system HicB family antitoxin [Chloroflexi bacterium]|nr:toxin-antitoxin system HicB family antitoxin [Chloroflexota bacterium]